MRKPSLAPERSSHLSVSAFRKHFSINKTGLLRFGSAFLILVLLAQVLFIGPVHSVKATSRILSPRPVSVPPEPFVVHNLSYSFAESFVLGIAFLSKANEFFNEPTIREDFAPTQPSPLGKNLIFGISSMFAFLAPRTKTTNAYANRPITTASMANQAEYDFDGDGKADIGRWHPANHTFEIKRSSDGQNVATSIGNPSSIPVPGDYDGDGTWDVAVFAAGAWIVKYSTDGELHEISCGEAGDIPMVGDYDSDQKTDAAVFRPSNGNWLIRRSSDSELVEVSFGQPGDIPIPGDYDADGTTDVAVYRSEDGLGYWYLHQSSGGDVTYQWGLSIDIPVQGDFDGDGRSDLTVYRPSEGMWYIGSSTNGGELIGKFAWGNYNDQPAPADYNGDGRTDYCVWRPTTGVWHIYYTPETPGEYLKENYATYALGVPGDRAIPSAYTRQIGGTVTGYELATARLAPRNATGGTNFYSQNFSWGTSLVSLPGRSGLNAGFGIGYNSLVWIKSGSAMYFDPDTSNVSPGFRFGFPVIEPIYYDNQKGRWAYMMITPDGGRKEFRQQGASNYFETADSSYTQLKILGNSNPNSPVEEITMTVTTTDGTQMSYVWNTGAYRCTQIKDRNGNYITNTYSEGLLITMTDTLGRVVSVNYDSGHSPIWITQTWKNNNGQGSNVTHIWATLSYTNKTVDTDFDSSLSIFGPPDTTPIKVLDKITYADGNATKFEYNDYIQVKKISTIAADSHVLNYVSTNLSNPSSNQQDCPRFTETRTKAEDFNGGSEVVVNNSFATGQQYTLPDNSTATGTKIEISGPNSNGVAGALVTKIYSASSGWAEALPVVTEDWTSEANAGENPSLTKNRWTWTDWEQDIIGGPLPYVCNPRVKETRVGDGTNTKKITMSYIMSYTDEDAVSYFGLVDETKVYDDTDTVLKTQKNTYLADSNYSLRRLIGLPLETKLYEGTSGSGTLVSKVTYKYDADSLTNLSNATNHDTANYGTNFSFRGNLIRTKRWDVTAPTSSSLAVSSYTAYNIAGSPISQTDPRNRVTNISYTDNFNSSGNPATFAYPTTVTDPGGNSSTIQYRYDFGANIWARSPKPEGPNNVYGKTTSRTYNNTTGRIEKEKIENPISGAYTRYEYSNTGAALTTYTTIVDVEGTSEYVNVEDEVQTVTLFDGAGRVIKTRTQNPGSQGGWTGKLIEYNILGQLKRVTVPTEMDSDWNRAGDDAAPRPWLWNWKFYDWKGRVIRTRPSDSDGTEAKDTIITYAGCGCAGGQVTTIQGPVADAINLGGETPVSGRKTQKVREDILGRTVATEVWSLDGGSLYSTTINHYNGRDQITDIMQYAGAEGSSTPQITNMTYDGHGRLSTLHKPEYDASTFTTTTYNVDDTVATVTDPRNASMTYAYETESGTLKRPLVSTIAYAAPSPIPVPSPVNFAYDDAGNRTSMSDGTGTLTYTYDELSRLKTETKDFLDDMPGAPGGGVYALTYDYHLAGSVESITDPFGYKTTYGSDKIGRITKIGAAGAGTLSGETAFASGIAYRAFGAVKSMSLSTTATTTVLMTYDNALMPASYEASNIPNSILTHVQKANYTYGNDGLLKEVSNVKDHNFDQKNEYDFAARLKKNDVGQSTSSHPFLQTMTYDAFSNLTGRANTSYGDYDGFTGATYSNNRKTAGGNSSDTYDAAGNVVTSLGASDNKHWKFDAAGRATYWDQLRDGVTKSEETKFDGDGRVVKLRDLDNATWYYIYSSLKGQKVTDLGPGGSRVVTHVYMDGSIIAEQWFDEVSDVTTFKLNDPLTGSMQQINSDGTFSPDNSEQNELYPNHNEMAALDTSVPLSAPSPPPGPHYHHGGFVGDSEYGCRVVNMDVPQACTNIHGFAYRVWENAEGRYAMRGEFVDFDEQYYITQIKTRPQNPKKKKPKCKQEKTFQERLAVELKLRDLVDPGVIGNVRAATDKDGNATEGIVFDIYNSDALHSALANAGFKTNTIFNGDHLNQVAGNILNTSDNRSDTVGMGNLGPDFNSDGVTRSLQVVTGPTITVTNPDGTTTSVTKGYADLDCSNPAQDLVSLVKHLFGR